MAKPQVISINPVHLHEGVTGSLAAPFGDVLWCVNCFCSETHVYVVYAGSPEQLIAAGCATPDMVAPYQHGQTVLDADGDRVTREFRKGWLRLERTKPVARALQLPGITIDAIRGAKHRSSQDRRAYRERLISSGITPAPWEEYPDLSAYERPRPQLRLVVNNTGETSMAKVTALRPAPDQRARDLWNKVADKSDEIRKLIDNIPGIGVRGEADRSDLGQTLELLVEAATLLEGMCKRYERWTNPDE